MSIGVKAGVNENFPSRPARLEPLQSEAGNFARVLQIEFVFDVRPVCLHRLWAEMQ